MSMGKDEKCLGHRPIISMNPLKVSVSYLLSLNHISHVLVSTQTIISGKHMAKSTSAGATLGVLYANCSMTECLAVVSFRQSGLGA